MLVEGERFLDSQHLHHGEADAVGEAETGGVILGEDVPGKVFDFRRQIVELLG